MPLRAAAGADEGDGAVVPGANASEATATAPETTSIPPAGTKEEDTDGENHWAFQPIVRPEAPAEGPAAVDHFLRRRLAAVDLAQNPPADRATLLRRVTLDLTGLPPTREELAGFLADDSPDAWEKLVEHLLASPHYGERWGRHWLDLARYVQGSIKVPGVDRIDLAEEYRDYVVRAFNEDKPFDRFVAEQLAGDLLPKKGRPREEVLDQLAAPAFLSIGPWFDECTDPNKLHLDIADEQISTLSRAFLAMDFACSRCHDHKFDPVPTRDYYAMAGILRSTEITSRFSEAWRDGRPRLVQPLALPEERERTRRAEEKVATLLGERRELLAAARDRLLREGREKALAGRIDRARKAAPDRLLATVEAEHFDGQKELKTVPLEKDPEGTPDKNAGGNAALATRRALHQWAKYYLEIPEAGEHWIYLRYASDKKAPLEIEINGETQESGFPGERTGGRDAESFRWQRCGPYAMKQGRVPLRFLADRHQPFPLLDRIRVVRMAGGPGSDSGGDEDSESTPGNRLTELLSAAPEAWPPTTAEAENLLDAEESQALAALDQRIAEAEAAVPRWPMTLAVRDAGEMRNLPVHTGGKVYQTEGELVPRAVPTLAEKWIKNEYPVPPGESGRLQLARWLTDPGHPLTARVLANRVWQWHFGRGLVRTSDDFGRQGADPTHPELLDFLASELIDSGWSVKHLHRLILLSRSYRVSSEPNPESLARDPDAALLSRFPRRRLEVEALYDSMATSIGKVPRQEPGAPLDTERSKDRALYILTSARSPMGLGQEIRKMFSLFGFDDSGRPMHRRDRSTTPDQALWWLNNPLPRYYAEKLAEKILDEHGTDRERAGALVETVLAKPAGGPADQGVLDYVRRAQETLDLEEPEAWTRAALGLFSTDGFSMME